MAASAPPPNISSAWIESHKSPHEVSSSEGPELDISGMSLMSSFGASDSKHPDMMTEKDGTDGGPRMESRRTDGELSNASGRSSTGSPVSNSAGQAKGGIGMPPGLGITAPSPIGKPAPAQTTSNSAPMKPTLTPTSSVDGGDIFGLGRQSSPFHGDGPSMSSDYGRLGTEDSDAPPGISNLGSLDVPTVDPEGLLGLHTLGDRAPNTSGVSSYSSSPPVHGQLGGFDESLGRARAVMRTYSGSTSRPPRAGLSPLNADQKAFQPGFSTGSSGNKSREQSPSPGYSQDSDSRVPGIISRPGLSQFDQPPERLYEATSRRRSISTETGREYVHSNYGDSGLTSIDHLSQQFAQLPSLGSQQQHGHSQSLHPDQHNFQRQQRSFSQPGPMRGPGGQEDGYLDEVQQTRRGSDYGIGMSTGTRMPPGMENEYSDPRYVQHHSQPYGFQPQGRRYSMTQVPASSMETPQPQVTQRRSSLTAVPMSGSGFYGQQYNVHRRESLDFVPGHNRYPDGVPVVASNEEMRGLSSSDDRGRNYRSQSYGSQQGRHQGDLGNNLRMKQGHDAYGGSRGSHHRASEEDRSHSMVGGSGHSDDRGYGHNEGNRGRGPPGTMDQLPHYGGVDAAHHLPTAGSALPMPKVVYGIKFKRTQRNFVLGPRLNRDLKVGTYVKVEADRGEDLGIVVGRVPSEKQNAPGRSGYRGAMGEMGMMQPSSGTGDLKRIIRLATHDEVSLLQMKREEEEELLKICRGKVRQRGLPMHVVDAEYQFDRHKLTFFFEAEGRIDFRELVRDLFSMYKTRIWMQQLDKTTSATCPTGPQQAQPLVMDYGTPIMAPESEYSEFSNGPPGDNGTD